MPFTFATIRRLLPIGVLMAFTLALPSAASARPTENLISNPSFENGFQDWDTRGARGFTSSNVADAPDGARVGGATGWLLNSQMSITSAWQPLDGRAVPGTCAARAQVRMNSATSRSGYLVLTERNGFGAVIREYKSPRVAFGAKFQTIATSGAFSVVSGNKLVVAIIVDGASKRGGDSFLVDSVDTRCTALPPLHVHLGDSYSSGAGSETMPTLNGRVVDNSVAERIPLLNIINPCYKTTNNAARLLGKQLGQRVTDWSCAGAKTENILTKRELGIVPLQIGGVTSDAALVTLTIGGNDAALLNILFCSNRPDECTDTSPEIQQSYGLLDATRIGLRNTLAAITKRAPNAEVRLANYPYLLPVPGSSSGACGAIITQGEMRMGKELQDRYAEIVREVVGEFGTKVRFVDVNAPGSPFNAVDEYGTRDFCSISPNRWMNGFIDLQADSRIGAVHPNAKGYQYYTQMYSKSLEGIDSVRN